MGKHRKVLKLFEQLADLAQEANIVSYLLENEAGVDKFSLVRKAKSDLQIIMNRLSVLSEPYDFFINRIGISNDEYISTAEVQRLSNSEFILGLAKTHKWRFKKVKDGAYVRYFWHKDDVYGYLRKNNYDIDIEKFYTCAQLVKILGLKRQRIHQIALENDIQKHLYFGAVIWLKNDWEEIIKKRKGLSKGLINTVEDIKEFIETF